MTERAAHKTEGWRAVDDSVLDISGHTVCICYRDGVESLDPLSPDGPDTRESDAAAIAQLPELLRKLDNYRDGLAAANRIIDELRHPSHEVWEAFKRPVEGDMAYRIFALKLRAAVEAASTPGGATQ